MEISGPKAETKCVPRAASRVTLATGADVLDAQGAAHVTQAAAQGSCKSMGIRSLCLFNGPRVVLVLLSRNEAPPPPVCELSVVKS